MNEEDYLIGYADGSQDRIENASEWIETAKRHTRDSDYWQGYDNGYCGDDNEVTGKRWSEEN